LNVVEFLNIKNFCLPCLILPAASQRHGVWLTMFNLGVCVDEYKRKPKGFEKILANFELYVSYPDNIHGNLHVSYCCWVEGKQSGTQTLIY